MLKITYVRTCELVPNGYNPRKYSKEDLAQLKKSIKEHSLVDPIIINSSPSRKNIIVGGEMRWKVCKELKYKEVPCIELDIPDLEKEKALCLRLNAISGDWDSSMLEVFDENFLLDVGFEPEDLLEIYGDIIDSEEDEFSVTKELEKIKEPKSKLGDIYLLGKHKLCCGNSQDPEVVKKLVGDEKIDMIYCDGPYNIGVSYKSGIGGTKNYSDSKYDDSLSDKEYEAFIKKTMENALSVSNKDVHCFYFSDQKYAPMMVKLYKELGITFKRTCIWLKGVATPHHK